MKYIRKSVSVLIIFSLVLILSLPGVNAGIIYESKTTEVVTSGVTLETITRFADDGWQKINVLRVNLDNPNVKVDTLTNSESIKNLTNVKKLAESSGAVAAINASFFSWLSESGKGDPIGPIIQSGEVLSIDTEFNRYNDSMVTLAIDNENNVYYNYWKSSIEMFAPDGSMAKISQYNKYSIRDYNDLTIWTPMWSKYSLGASEEYNDMVEMVVVDRVVVEVRRNLPTVEIPQNGYVIMGRGSYGEYLYNNFKIGDKVNFTISTTIDWDNIEMAATGGALLVKDGKIPSKFSHDASGASRRPRTAAGSSKSGKELILVTVDGDQSVIKGMTMKELANLMLSLGAYNAINFDGGGSTTMVSRAPVSNNLKVVSNVAGGSMRSIATAIGIFSVCPPSSLEGLIIDKEQPNVFVNTSVKLSARGYDTYFNPLAVDQSKIEWSVSGVEGSFKGNTFYPKSSGLGTITASIDGITSSTNIMVLDKPNRLVLSSKELYLATGASHTLTVKASDSNGYTSNINPDDITWILEGNIGELENNTFTATKNGIGYIKASLGDVHAYCAVSVAEETLHTVDKFEKANGTFLSVPADLPGSYELSNEQKLTGNYAGKLTYDFSYLDGTRAAYLVFNNDGLDLSENTTELSMWVYSPRENSNWLRAEVIDADGKKHLISFCNGMDWTGWKRVFASLKDIASPTKLTRLYLAQINPVPESGSIYIDDLSFKQAKFPEIDKNEVPQDVFAPDAANKKTELTEDSIRFSVVANTIEKPQNMLQKLMNLRFAEGVKADDTIKDPHIISKIKSYDHFDAGKSRFITLDTSNKSLRTSSSGQWQWFTDKLESFSGDNIFIFMKNPPSTFSDSLEANLFKKVLLEQKEKTGKNIWVFYNGSTNAYTAENGVRYFSLAEVNTTGLTPENAVDAKYIEITAKGNDVSYQYKSMFE